MILCPERDKSFVMDVSTCRVTVYLFAYGIVCLWRRMGYCLAARPGCTMLTSRRLHSYGKTPPPVHTRLKRKRRVLMVLCIHDVAEYNTVNWASQVGDSTLQLITVWVDATGAVFTAEKVLFREGPVHHLHSDSLCDFDSRAFPRC